MYQPNTIQSARSCGSILNLSDGRPSPKRGCFIDYFPLTNAKYPGLIRAHDFEGRMKIVINECINSAGSLSKYSRLPQPVNFHLKNNDLNETDYYQEIKVLLSFRIFDVEWRTPNEMEMSKKMYAQSGNYLKSAGKDLGIALATWGIGKGIGKLGKIRNKSIQKGMIKTETTSIKGTVVNVSKSIEVNLGKKNNWGRNVSIFKGLGKKADAKLSFGFDILEANTSIWQRNAETGYNELASNDFEEFNCMDYSTYGMNEDVNNVLDIATDFVPYLGQAKLALNIISNAGLSVKSFFDAKQLKKGEEKLNAADKNFNLELKQTIHDDVLALYPEEIKQLIDMTNSIE